MTNLSYSIKFAIIALSLLGCFVVPKVFAYHQSAAKKSVVAPLSSYLPHIPGGIPRSLWLKRIPRDNPMTAEKVALGEALYYDKRLSSDGTLSCATCHDPARAFASADALAVGINNRVGVRNAPTVLNAMFGGSLFWDGRAASLEEQVKEPLLNPAEMGMQNPSAVVARVSGVPDYRQRFQRVFGGEGISLGTIAKAIAAYERTRLSGDSPFDRFIAGDQGALTEAQKRGWKLFQHKARCITCHTFAASSPFFTDGGFHNTGVAAAGINFGQAVGRTSMIASPRLSGGTNPGDLAHSEGAADLGRYLMTKRLRDVGAFKTPTLRDVELTTPYMHDGSEKTLLDVVKFYNRGGNPNRYLDAEMRPLNLTEAEMNELVEFMRALTSDEVLRQTQRSTPQTREPAPAPPARR